MKATTMTYPATWENKWYMYSPREGLDPYIYPSTLWRGALHYAMAKSRNMSEEECHNRAEEAMFLHTFSGITYKQEVNTGSQQGKKRQCLAKHNWPPMILSKTVETLGGS
jgi:hypothetical protein